TGKLATGTPPGVFAIQQRIYNETMDSRSIGIPPGHPDFYRLENVLYTQYYTNRGHAIHYAWWHNNFGHPMSHGCVNLRLSTARWFWNWAGIGTTVIVH
ncbi:MAG: L,D-transpeptidase, partial [Chloroflexota bacterium]